MDRPGMADKRDSPDELEISGTSVCFFGIILSGGGLTRPERYGESRSEREPCFRNTLYGLLIVRYSRDSTAREHPRSATQ